MFIELISQLENNVKYFICEEFILSYLLLFAVLLLTVKRSSAQLDGDSPPLPNTGEYFNMVNHVMFGLTYIHIL